MTNDQIMKRSGILFFSLFFFAALTIPAYFLMLAGAKSTAMAGGEATILTDAPVRNIFSAPEGEDTEDGETPDGDANGQTQEDGSEEDDPFNGLLQPEESETASEEDPMDGLSEEDARDFNMPGLENMTESVEDPLITMLHTSFTLNKLAFFGGMALILVLYIVYYFTVLRKQFYALCVGGDRTELVGAMAPFLIFIIMEVIQIVMIPTYLTKRLASFEGLQWEVAYVIPAFFVLFTLVAVWKNTDVNRILYLDDEIPFRYAKFGKGEHSLIIIAGLATRTMEGAGIGLEKSYRIFKENYTVYVMDKKDEVPEDVTIEDLAEDIAKAMDKLGIKRADVYGVSQGGMIAQYLAINHPKKVRKLVLGVTASRVNETLENYINRCIILAKKGDFATINKESFELTYTDEKLKPMKPFLPLLAKMSVPKSNTRFIRLAKSILTLDIYEKLDQIKSTTFVYGAGKDKIATVAASEEIAEKLNCQKYIYRNLKHGAYDEAKDVNDRIYRFLEKP